ncbi:type 2 lanthipeptide synthetase LanM family protein [Pseudoxanthomonas sacheonensis]|uniref:Type 2 lantibiotic biosynthesis protein LanM n=1 Tax=Pseudoxanthomonas sacheonensis TaxID=443615 RepID=A0ABU1RVP9_9GAMM|nr:type 2 lanthipeptide synthetase LanM family protein [Pseudoxanthomonas sacheonensis]MDR6842844.1 type 2 lantibiotic biosynthesis protein LanM [Pseudoxanthomonas sacheonensis]
MSEPGAPDAFIRIIDHFTAPARARLAGSLSGLGREEAALAQAVADEALRHSARLKLNRVLLLELHAAARAGELTAEDDAGRFAQFIERSLRPEFVEHLDRRYPPLLRRLRRALDQQRGAIEALLTRFVADREALEHLLGRPAGRLIGLSLGQGDLHAGGQTVARLALEGGTVMYKPRSLRIDTVLDSFLARVFGDGPDRVRVPPVIDRGDYGWAAFVAHRYCDGEAELQTFYRGLGHWLAVLRLLGGTDIHLENLIAVGPVPVIIDVESLFEAAYESAPSPHGRAYDSALMLIRNSVLRTGIVPFRTPALGLDGVDISAAGALPDQQPQVHAPVIVDEGTMRARLEVVNVDVAMAQNHPGPNPDVSLYWDQISEGFLDATARLRALNDDDRLASSLAAFEGCRVREIRRATKAYVEIGRMLWHPASLHDEAAAIERARDLLSRNAAAFAGAPSAAAEIMAEIDDLRHGDVPIFAMPLSRARIDAVFADWRAMRIDLEELTIRSSLVATDLNQRMRDREQERSGHLYAARNPHADRLEARRRKLAADAVARLLRLAIRGDDGTTTWITPEINRSGWLVQPVQPDLYFGLGGIAVVLAGYSSEVESGRADAVDGVEEALAGALRVLRTMAAAEKPATVGGFSGYGSQIWTWLALHDLRHEPDMLACAIRHAEALEREGFEGDDRFDIVDGASGAIVPLLGLAEATGDARWLALASRAAQRLEQAAIVDAKGARWPTAGSDEPSSGFAHGATGVAWSLARLVLSGAGAETDRARWQALSDAAFAFQERFYDEALGNWLDARNEDREASFHTWCHGSVGIGLAAGDLYAHTRHPRHLLTLRRSVATARGMWGSSHTLCHGDMSLRELFARAASLDPEGCASDPDEPTAQIVSSIEEHRGMVGGLTRAAFTPGLMTGLAGAIHGLNRMHPDCKLASPLLLERRRRAA